MVGDWVRWEFDKRWLEGELRGLASDGQVASVKAAYSSREPEIGEMMDLLSCNLRRIPRPQQGEARHAFLRGPSGDGRLGPPDETCAVCQRDPRNSVHHREWCKMTRRGLACGCAIGEPVRHVTAHAPMLYDGLTIENCAERWEVNRVRVDDCLIPIHVLTPQQVEVGRRAYQELTQTNWSARLRAKIAASAMAERDLVRCDLDDLDGEPW